MSTRAIKPIPRSGPIELTQCYEALFFDEYQKQGSIYKDAKLDTRSIRDIVHKKDDPVNMSDLYGKMGGCHPWNNGKGESFRKPGFHHIEEIQLGGNMDVVDGYYPTPQVNHPDTQYRDPAVIPDSAFNDQYSCEIKGSNGNGFRSAMNQNISFYHEREHNQQDMELEIVMRAVSSPQDADSGVYIVVVGYRDWWGQGVQYTGHSERILGQSGGDTGWITKQVRCDMSYTNPYITVSLQCINSPTAPGYARFYGRISQLDVMKSPDP